MSSIVCTHNTLNVTHFLGHTHFLGQVRAKILCQNLIPMHSLYIMGRAYQMLQIL
jgi:hypothetical protein